MSKLSKTVLTDPNQSRGNRLARRAKSFKDDLLGKINQIRSPSGNRAVSPCKNIKSKTKNIPESLEDCPSNKPKKDINTILHSLHLLSTDLRYFQDVVEKNILEMLPGSATVILETVLNIHSALRESLLNEQSSLILSASNQVYQTLANLIRWADNVLLYGEKSTGKENISDIIQALRDAVKNLVQLSLDRLNLRDPHNSANVSDKEIFSSSKPESIHVQNSLSDISLTPWELKKIEQTTTNDKSVLNQLHHSASSDSVLNTGISSNMVQDPPPKPPLPSFRRTATVKSNSSFEDSLFNCEFFLDSAPPLPPKKKVINNNCSELDNFFPITRSSLLCGSCGSINTEINSLCAIDFTSPFSLSPENLTPISKSSASSLDSILDNSPEGFTCSKINYSKCTESKEITCFKQQQQPVNTQIYNYEHGSYSNVETSASSVSLDSNDIYERRNETSLKEISVTNTETFIQSTYTNEKTPPILPIKLRKLRNLSQYDNVPQLLVSDLELKDHLKPQCHFIHSSQSWKEEAHTQVCPLRYLKFDDHEMEKPPPLPPKERTIKAYMQMFGSYSQPSESEFLRHSVHTLKVVQTNWQQVELSFLQQPSFDYSFTTSSEDFSLCDHFSNSKMKSLEEGNLTPPPPPSIPPKKNKIFHKTIAEQEGINSVSDVPLKSIESDVQHIDTTENNRTFSSDKTNFLQSTSVETNLSDGHNSLDELDPSEFLIWKKNGEEGPDLRGGSVDSLIVQATKVSKNDFLYQEAFLTTYRTFISPHDLICKLLYRYNKFIHVSDLRQRAARNSFALLVRIVDDLSITDLHDDILKILMDFICQLVCRGDLLLARALRKKVVEKCYIKQQSLLNVPLILPSMPITTQKATLLDFKSESIAEQMTLLDAHLFQKIEIPEVLLWAREQKEDLSPNLTTFTEHFNKMSYWARSRILEQEEAKDREKYVVKFIKVMKCLRKLNNFNSYLSILSALDSAPIRRLEWQKNITEGLKEYCALIDSSSSFRAYRLALSETNPPCIPYIGLILQDLTFVHIGNNDMLMENTVNFSKRWQQFNILDNMRRFKNCHYPVARNEQILAFFNNFDDYLSEEAMWQISETIKPRGGKKKNFDQS